MELINGDQSIITPGKTSRDDNLLRNGGNPRFLHQNIDLSKSEEIISDTT